MDNQGYDSTYIPKKVATFIVSVISTSIIIYTAMSIGFAPVEENFALLVNKIIKANTTEKMIMLINMTSDTFDVDMITEMFDQERNNIIDSFKMATYGLEGAGEMWTDVAEPMKKKLEELIDNPSLLNRMSKKEIECYVRGVVFHDQKYFSADVMRGGVVEMRNPERVNEILDQMKSISTVQQEDFFLIAEITPKLREHVMSVLDKNHAQEAFHSATFLGINKFVFSRLTSAHFYRIVETFVKFLRISHTAHVEYIKNHGTDSFLTTTQWLINLWTGDGCCILPLIFFAILAFKFCFNGTAISVLYKWIVESNPNHWYTKYIEIMVTEYVNMTCYVLAAFALSNVICMTACWFLYVNFDERDLGIWIFDIVSNRMHTKDMIDEEMLNGATFMQFFIVTGMISLEKLMNYLTKYLVKSIFMKIFGIEASNGTISVDRTYNYYFRKLPFVNIIVYACSSSDYYSIIWKTFVHIIDLFCITYTGTPLPVDVHLNEINGLVAWVAGVWNVKNRQ